MSGQPFKILIIDCVEKDTLPLGGVDGWFRAALRKCDPEVEVKTVRASIPDWEKEALPLGGVDGWFRAALRKCDSKVDVKTVRASTPDWEKEVAWADAVMISGSPRDAFADDEWTHALMAKVARLLEKKKPVLGVCYGHQILGRVEGGKVGRCNEGWELGETKVEVTPEGLSSPLLEGLPKQMNVMQSHRDLKRKSVPLRAYFCQIGDSTTSYGSYSGAVPNEKITWGKLGADTPKYVIESDATIVAPLIFSYILGH